MSLYHWLGLDADEPYEARVERYRIENKLGRYNRPPKVNDSYIV